MRQTQDLRDQRPRGFTLCEIDERLRSDFGIHALKRTLQEVVLTPFASYVNIRCHNPEVNLMATEGNICRLFDLSQIQQKSATKKKTAQLNEKPKFDGSECRVYHIARYHKKKIC